MPQRSPSHGPARASERIDLEGLRIVKIDFTEIDVIRRLNVAIFDEERVINTFDRADLLMLVAYVGEKPAGFKVGYRHMLDTYYSAKGGVLAAYRRKGIARKLLYEMMDHVRNMGYRHFIYDTFPNKHPGMTVLGLREGFRLAKADFNAVYKDYRLQFSKEL